MRRALAAAMVAAVVLTGCARSEDADTKVLRNDIDNAPAALPAEPANDAAAAPMGEAGIAAALRKDAAGDGGFGETPKWMMERADLNGDGVDEALAYVLDPMFCGTGGCTLYVLGQKDGAWSVISKIGPSRLPIYKLDAGPDGWVNLGVTIGGGGAAPSVMSVPHDSNGYADNPTVAPAKPVEVAGKEALIADGEGAPLPAE